MSCLCLVMVPSCVRISTLVCVCVCCKFQLWIKICCSMSVSVTVHPQLSCPHPCLVLRDFQKINNYNLRAPPSPQGSVCVCVSVSPSSPRGTTHSSRLQSYWLDQQTGFKQTPAADYMPVIDNCGNLSHLYLAVSRRDIPSHPSMLQCVLPSSFRKIPPTPKTFFYCIVLKDLRPSGLP